MKAIVLTYDKSRALTEHMIFKYQELWSENPFLFRIPYQTLQGKNNSKCEYIQTPIDIKGTVLTLLTDLDDNEWIYWCIDDKYPIFLDLPRIMRVMEWTLNSSPEHCSGVLFCRIREVLNGNALQQDWLGRDISFQDSCKNIYLRRKNYEQIWLHQFLRVKVLRYLFQEMPGAIPNAKLMDSLKYKVSLPESHHLFVVKDNLAVFGESTSRGELTLNCYKSIEENALELPEMDVNKKINIVLGETNSQLSSAQKIQFWWRKFKRKIRIYDRIQNIVKR